MQSWQRLGRRNGISTVQGIENIGTAQGQTGLPEPVSGKLREPTGPSTHPKVRVVPPSALG